MCASITVCCLIEELCFVFEMKADVAADVSKIVDLFYGMANISMMPNVCTELGLDKSSQEWKCREKSIFYSSSSCKKE